MDACPVCCGVAFWRWIDFLIARALLSGLVSGTYLTCMLKALNVCLEVDGPQDSEKNSTLHLLREVSFNVPPAHLVAIVGPSGCGKTTLLKVITGIQQQTSGELLWDGMDLSDEEDLHPGDLGYVPQFSVAYDLLTVEESIASAMTLRKVGRSPRIGHANSMVQIGMV